MKIEDRKKCALAVSLALLPFVVLGVPLLHSNLSINQTKASTYSSVLSSNNSPVLTSGEGTMTDDKNVTWEYFNAEDNPSGHVSLNHEGYFGVSSSTTWGYTNIDSLTVDFTTGENGELWLLTSINGTDWEEGEILTSNSETHAADNWRFVRFYYWDEDGETADITSLSIGYDCVGVSNSDDPDLAKVENLRKCDDLDPTVEYEIVSPRCGSTQALRLTTTSGAVSSSTKHETIFNIPVTTLEKLQGYKIEFDYYYKVKRDPKKAPGYPSIKTAAASSASGTYRSYDSKVAAYTCDAFADGWWHFECYVSYILQEAEHKLSETIYGITIYDEAIYEHIRDGESFVGYVVIDNLFLTNHERSGTVCNTWTTVTIGATGTNRYFIRENFCGSFHDVTYTCSDTSKATLSIEKKQGNDLCYINGVAEGDIVITITYKLGYDRETVVVQTKTLTVVSA